VEVTLATALAIMRPFQKGKKTNLRLKFVSSCLLGTCVPS
jgi:hypothetical protein